MIDWSEVSDDEFVEEANRRVNQGNWSPDRYMSKIQCDYKAKLDYLRSAVVHAKVLEPTNILVCKLVLVSDQLDSISCNPLDQIRIQAINTTFYGKDNIYQNHSPENQP